MTSFTRLFSSRYLRLAFLGENEDSPDPGTHKRRLIFFPKERDVPKLTWEKMNAAAAKQAAAYSTGKFSVNYYPAERQKQSTRKSWNENSTIPSAALCPKGKICESHPPDKQLQDALTRLVMQICDLIHVGSNGYLSSKKALTTSSLWGRENVALQLCTPRRPLNERLSVDYVSLSTSCLRLWREFSKCGHFWNPEREREDTLMIIYCV